MSSIPKSELDELKLFIGHHRLLTDEELTFLGDDYWYSIFNLVNSPLLKFKEIIEEMLHQNKLEIPVVWVKALICAIEALYQYIRYKYDTNVQEYRTTTQSYQHLDANEKEDSLKKKIAETAELLNYDNEKRKARLNELYKVIIKKYDTPYGEDTPFSEDTKDMKSLMKILEKIYSNELITGVVV